MKAAICRQFGSPLTVEDIELDQIQAGEVRVAIKACAICHSDIACMNGAWGGELPAVFGHEAAGIVEEVGNQVTTVKPGDHVVVTLIRSCGHCTHCAQGAPFACGTKFYRDSHSPLKCETVSIHQGLNTGAFAEQVVVDASQIVGINPAISFEVASLLACGALTGFCAVTNSAQVPVGSDIVVIGTGGVGLNTVQGAKFSGAKSIIAIDISDAKLQAALDFGATHTINPTKEAPYSVVKKITGNKRADFVFVTVGSEIAMEQAYRLIGRRGSAVLVGMPPNGTLSSFDPSALAAQSQSIIGSKMGSGRVNVDIPMLAELYLQGRIKLDELISHRYSLDQINDAIANCADPSTLRNVIVMDDKP